MKILHRDMSVENMMYRLDAENNVVGVLNGFDLAVMLSEQENGPVSKQRIGTRPYMAIELLESADGNPPLHLCHDGLESMMYVILDLACYRHIPEKEQETSSIKVWFSVEFTAPQLALGKLGFLMGNNLPNASKEMENLLPLAHRLVKMFHQGYFARGDTKCPGMIDEFDSDTLGGFVTLDKFTKFFGL